MHPSVFHLSARTGTPTTGSTLTALPSTPGQAEAYNMQLWGSQARTAVCSAHQALTNTPLTPCNQLHFGSPLVNSSVCMADVLSNTPVCGLRTQFGCSQGWSGTRRAVRQPSCTGLETVLSAGYTVSQYFNSDISKEQGTAPVLPPRPCLEPPLPPPERSLSFPIYPSPASPGCPQHHCAAPAAGYHQLSQPPPLTLDGGGWLAL